MAPRPQHLIALIAALCTAPLFAQTAPTLSVNVSSGRYPISPNIYGIAYNQYATSSINQAVALPVVRWGGDETSRYNWNYDSSNSGFDFYFMSGNPSSTYTPGGTVDGMIAGNQPGASLVTIPIIPYVNSSPILNCSYPVSVYGAQQQTNPYQTGAQGTCGNGLTVAGVEIPDTAISSNNMPNSTALQTSWLQHLVNKFGTASQGGVQFYQLDNEPYGWANIHRDILPVQPTYPTIVVLGEQYGAAIKAVDPSALVLGPSDFTLGGWLGDPAQQNGQYAGVYYLQQMAAYEKQTGTRLLDYFDEHYYFNFTDEATQLASTRTLWDPTYNGGTWIEQYYFDGPMDLIPRFQGWIAANYPGTKLSISEYSIASGNNTVVDAIAQMDVLGIFGRQQLDLATMWYPPLSTDTTAYAFYMFRNYDGQGSQYGDTWVSSTSTDQTQLSIYGSQRTSDSVVTMLVINKTTSPISTTLALSGVNLPATASVYSYSAANLFAILPGPAAAISNGSIAYTFPAYSATLFTFAPVPTAPGPVATTTVVTATPQTVTLGQTVSLQATVTGAAPTGTVSFSVEGIVLGSAAVGADGTARLTLQTTDFPAGTFPIVATYSGDAANQPSASAAVNVILVPKIATTTTMSVAVLTLVAGGGDLFTVTVAPGSGVGVPTGTVELIYAGHVLSTVALDANGNAIFPVVTAGVASGTYSLTASYSGDANYAASTSAPVLVVVTDSDSLGIPFGDALTNKR